MTKIILLDQNGKTIQELPSLQFLPKAGEKVSIKFSSQKIVYQIVDVIYMIEEGSVLLIAGDFKLTNY